jgi:hypothetical protein
MLRKTMIVLLTAAALTGVLTANAFARGGGGGGHGADSAVAVIWAAGSAAALAWAAALAEAISPVVAWLSVAALRLMPRCAATSAAITFIAADVSIAASGSVAAMTTGATSTPITSRTAICMGTDVFRVPLHDVDEGFAGLITYT